MKKFIRQFIFILILAVLNPMMLGKNAFAQEYRVAIVRVKISGPYDQTPFEQAIDGFRNELDTRRYDVDYQTFSFEYGKPIGKIIEGIRNFDPNLVLTIGTDATIFVKKSFPQTPILFTMILDPVRAGVTKSLSSPGGNVTGVMINVSVEQQFRELLALIPDVRTVGMLYDANAPIGLKNKQQAEAAAKRTGLSLVAKPIYSRSEIVNKLEEVLRESDALWAGADPTIYNPQSTETIIRTTLRYGKPFMAFTNFVKSGALLGVGPDYDDIGRQTATLGIRILNGQSPGNVSIEEPRQLQTFVHKEAARRLGVKLPRNFLEDAVIFE